MARTAHPVRTELPSSTGAPVIVAIMLICLLEWNLDWPFVAEIHHTGSHLYPKDTPPGRRSRTTLSQAFGSLNTSMRLKPLQHFSASSLNIHVCLPDLHLCVMISLREAHHTPTGSAFAILSQSAFTRFIRLHASMIMARLIISTSKKRWQFPTRSKQTRNASFVFASSPILSISALDTGLSISFINLETYPSQSIFFDLYAFNRIHEGDSTLPALRVTSMITAPGSIFFTFPKFPKYVSFKPILNHELSNYR